MAGVVIGGVSVNARRFSWNMTPSLPRGLYYLDIQATPAVGDIVAFGVPTSVADLVSRRRYLPRGARLLKRVVATAGDHVCVDGYTFEVNRRAVSAVQLNDATGRPLPACRFCGRVPSGEAFVATTVPLSFDSRYFGSLPISALTVARPIWTY